MASIHNAYFIIKIPSGFTIENNNYFSCIGLTDNSGDIGNFIYDSDNDYYYTDEAVEIDADANDQFQLTFNLNTAIDDVSIKTINTYLHSHNINSFTSITATTGSDGLATIKLIATLNQDQDATWTAELYISKTYTISNDIDNGTYSGDTSIETKETKTITITPNSGYILPDSITVYNADYTWDSSTGKLVLSNPTGSVSIYVTCIQGIKFINNSSVTVYLYSPDNLSSAVASFAGNTTTTLNMAKYEKIYVAASTKNTICYSFTNSDSVTEYDNNDVKLSSSSSFYKIEKYFTTDDVGTVTITDYVNNKIIVSNSDDETIYVIMKTDLTFDLVDEIESGAELEFEPVADSTTGYFVAYSSSKNITVDVDDDSTTYSLTQSTTINDVTYYYQHKFVMLYSDIGKTYVIETEKYDLTVSITNGSYSTSNDILAYGGTATVSINPYSGYDYPDSVTVSGADYSYDSTTGVVSLSNITGSVTVTGSCYQILYATVVNSSNRDIYIVNDELSEVTTISSGASASVDTRYHLIDTYKNATSSGLLNLYTGLKYNKKGIYFSTKVTINNSTYYYNTNIVFTSGTTYTIETAKVTINATINNNNIPIKCKIGSTSSYYNYGYIVNYDDTNSLIKFPPHLINFSSVQGYYAYTPTSETFSDSKLVQEYTQVGGMYINYYIVLLLKGFYDNISVHNNADDIDVSSNTTYDIRSLETYTNTLDGVEYTGIVLGASQVLDYDLTFTGTRKWNFINNTSYDLYSINSSDTVTTISNSGSVYLTETSYIASTVQGLVLSINGTRYELTTAKAINGTTYYVADTSTILDVNVQDYTIELGSTTINVYVSIPSTYTVVDEQGTFVNVDLVDFTKDSSTGYYKASLTSTDFLLGVTYVFGFSLDTIIGDASLSSISGYSAFDGLEYSSGSDGYSALRLTFTTANSGETQSYGASLSIKSTYIMYTNYFNCTISGVDTTDSITDGETKLITITPDDGYVLPDSVEVDNADYEYSNGVIAISNPSGQVNIVIKCVTGVYFKNNSDVTIYITNASGSGADTYTTVAEIASGNTSLIDLTAYDNNNFYIGASAKDTIGYTKVSDDVTYIYANEKQYFGEIYYLNTVFRSDNTTVLDTITITNYVNNKVRIINDYEADETLYLLWGNSNSLSVQTEIADNYGIYDLDISSSDVFLSDYYYYLAYTSQLRIQFDITDREGNETSVDYELTDTVTIDDVTYYYNSNIKFNYYDIGSTYYLSEYHDYKTVTVNVTNGSADNPSQMDYDEEISFTITANDGYRIPISITVSGANEYTYSNSSGKVTITGASSNVVVTAVCAKAYTVTNNTLYEISGLNTDLNSIVSSVQAGESNDFYEGDYISMSKRGVLLVTDSDGTTERYKLSNAWLYLPLMYYNPELQVTSDLTIEHDEFTINVEITNGTYSGENTIDSNDTKTITITPMDYYEILESGVSVTGAEYTFTDGVITLSNATDDVVVTIVCTAINYGISISVDNGTYAVSQETINVEESVTITITPSDYYILPSDVSVTNATYIYDSETGVITLTSPTGLVSVSASCDKKMYTITYSVTYGTITGDEEIWAGVQTVDTGVKVKLSAGYFSGILDKYPEWSFEIENASYEWITRKKKTGTFAIYAPTDNVTVTIYCGAKGKEITNLIGDDNLGNYLYHNTDDDEIITNYEKFGVNIYKEDGISTFAKQVYRANILLTEGYLSGDTLYSLDKGAIVEKDGGDVYNATILSKQIVDENLQEIDLDTCWKNLLINKVVAIKVEVCCATTYRSDFVSKSIRLLHFTGYYYYTTLFPTITIFNGGVTNVELYNDTLYCYTTLRNYFSKYATSNKKVKKNILDKTIVEETIPGTSIIFKNIVYTVNKENSYQDSAPYTKLFKFRDGAYLWGNYNGALYLIFNRKINNFILTCKNTSYASSTSYGNTSSDLTWNLEDNNYDQIYEYDEPVKAEITTESKYMTLPSGDYTIIKQGITSYCWGQRNDLDITLDIQQLLYFNNTEIDKIYFNGQEITTIFLNDTLVYENTEEYFTDEEEE